MPTSNLEKVQNTPYVPPRPVGTSGVLPQNLLTLVDQSLAIIYFSKWWRSLGMNIALVVY